MATFDVPPLGERYDAREFLVRFLKSFQTLLEETLREEAGRFIPRELYRYALAAYEPVPAQIERMILLTLEASLATLEEYGLTDDPLAYKLALIDYHNRRYDPALGRAPRQRRGGLLVRVLEAIDIPLESLVKALPGGEMVVEFKKGLEKMVPRRWGQIL